MLRVAHALAAHPVTATVAIDSWARRLLDHPPSRTMA